MELLKIGWVKYCRAGQPGFFPLIKLFPHIFESYLGLWTHWLSAVDKHERLDHHLPWHLGESYVIVIGLSNIKWKATA